jgi:hypothetical protein
VGLRGLDRGPRGHGEQTGRTVFCSNRTMAIPAAGTWEYMASAIGVGMALVVGTPIGGYLPTNQDATVGKFRWQLTIQ